MAYKGSLFYNYPSLGDVLVIVIANRATVNEAKVQGDVVGLYDGGGKLIGVNVFNANRYLKLRVSGLVHSLNEPLINLVHSLISSSLNEDVVLCEAKVLLGRVSSNPSEAEYLVDDGKKPDCRASILDPEAIIEPGDYVLLSSREDRLDNGDLASDYLYNGEEYLILGSEITPGEEDELGEKTYKVEAK